MKTIEEKLETKFHQTVGVGSAHTPGHSTLAEAAVVVLPNYFEPEGEVIGEHIDHLAHSSDHVLAHAKEGHLGHSFTHHMGGKETSGEYEVGGVKGFRHSEEDHPHKLRGDHMKHNPAHHGKHGKSHKNPHK